MHLSVILCSSYHHRILIDALFQNSAELIHQIRESYHNSFRWLLATYARTLYPITSVLPIGDDYEEFPFLLFRFNLPEIRQRIFSDTHLLISSEMNVLNMLLSYRNEQRKE